MYRRRRPVREITFSFDSFLDLVANVVGVIIRLILVVWVGARSYTGIVAVLPPQAAEVDETAITMSSPEGSPNDRVELPEPVAPDLLEHQKMLVELEKQLIEEMRRLQQLQDDRTTKKGELATLTAQRSELERKSTELARNLQEGNERSNRANLSAEELKARCRQLADEVKNLKALPPISKTLKHHTPISQPVFSEEQEFECRRGRVTVIETRTLFEEVKREFASRVNQDFKGEQLKLSTLAVGAFRMVFTVERTENGLSSGVGVASVYLDPLREDRGEPTEAAMRPNSEFRQVADHIDPLRTAVTFWVYPDSFDDYRQLRDYLYQRNITVAARPLPFQNPIGWSKRGTLSRGQ